MAANTGAEALTQFLSATPNPNSGGELMDRLGMALLTSGDEGLAFGAAMQLAGLSRQDFLSVLSTAISTGLVQTFDSGGEQRLKLSPAGRSLY